MFGKSKTIGNACGCFEFASVPLAVVEGQADDAVALFRARAAAVAESSPPESSAMAVRWLISGW